MNTMPQRASAWMRLPSGQRVDLANPDPYAWSDNDLSLRIARVYRWGGESMYPEPLSVAQHSLAVLELRRQWAVEPLTVGQQLRELLHDAEEALLGFDPISKLKPLLGVPLREVSGRLSEAIAIRYQLPDWTKEEQAAHKRVDVACAASEALYCVGWSQHEITDVLGIREPVLQRDPLTRLYDCEPWRPWPSALAYERFHFEFVRLLVAQDRQQLAKLA
ncbi:phosphohydrolase [Massilia sp.]|uniref:phosphohydrolase n=1 Tax=Massilia sp. TaxID=1882437 RepID=UPI00352DAD85